MTLFPRTRTSTVLDLASADDLRRARSLDAVVRAYWKPVYKYIRLRWPSHPAEDLTQSFFEIAIARDMLASYTPGRAKFRTFLRTCLERHVIDHHRKDVARGGKRMHFEFATAEAELSATGHHHDPQAVFDAEWLRHVMEVAVERLDSRLRERGKPVHAALFREFHIGEVNVSYSEAAARHGISVSNVTNWLHYARREFRRVALELLEELTVDDEDFAAEAMAVFGIDVRAGA